MQNMRILLQQIENGFYYSETGDWSPDCAEAKDFPNSTAVVDLCLAQRLAGVQLVLKFPGEKHEIVIPVLPGYATGVTVGQDAVRRTP
jgi:ActR/RegA family two-component response regulator